jgi:hypothetical protein
MYGLASIPRLGKKLDVEGSTNAFFAVGGNEHICRIKRISGLHELLRKSPTARAPGKETSWRALDAHLGHDSGSIARQSPLFPAVDVALLLRTSSRET